MKYRIMELKLNFLHYIISQENESLAQQILLEQRQENFPGLVQECNQFRSDLHLLDPFEIRLSKAEWKRMVKDSINIANSNELKEEIVEKYKKLKRSDLATEEFGRKEYLKNLNIQHARTKFKF